MPPNEKVKNVLIIIPARGGSKGIPKKNLSLIHDKSLTQWTIEAAKKVDFKPVIVVSSDSQEILHQSQMYPEITTSLRPKELSEDFVADFQVLRYELNKSESMNSMKFGCVVMLQPTSPIRNPETIELCIEAILNKDYSSSWTVSPIPVKYHARKQLLIEDGILKLVVDSPVVVARQNLSQSYIRTGACYAFSRETLLNDEKLLGDRALPVFCNWPSVNIDDFDDLARAREISTSSNGILAPKWELL